MRDATGAGMRGAYHTYHIWATRRVRLAASTSLVLMVPDYRVSLADASSEYVNWESMFAVVVSFPSFLFFLYRLSFSNRLFPLLLRLCRGPCPFKKLKRAT